MDAVVEPTKLLLRVEDAAELLGLGRSTIYQLIGNGELPVVRIGKKAVRVPYSALQAWIDKRSSE